MPGVPLELLSLNSACDALGTATTDDGRAVLASCASVVDKLLGGVVNPEVAAVDECLVRSAATPPPPSVTHGQWLREDAPPIPPSPSAHMSPANMVACRVSGSGVAAVKALVGSRGVVAKISEVLGDEAAGTACGPSDQHAPTRPTAERAGVYSSMRVRVCVLC